MNLPHTYHVGPGAVCDTASIQTAIDGGQAYDAIHLSIVDKNLTLRAGPCQTVIGGGMAAVAANAQVTLSGNSGASSAVLTISGASNVSLVDLKITGNASSSSGGGITFSGSGGLSLDNVEIIANSAFNGGGISFQGLNGSATLTLGENTQLINNTAQLSGGGIMLTGSSTLYMTAPSLLFDNHAPNGYGGGIEAVGPAALFVGSPGIAGIAAISQNDAEYGGGIALLAGTDDDTSDVFGTLFSTVAAQPVRLENNTASHTGGGVFAKPYLNTLPYRSNYATFCAQDFRIYSNIAQEGAAVYADTDSGGGLVSGGNVQLGGCTLPAFPAGVAPALACRHNAACNTIDNNEVDDPASGSAILIQSEGSLSGAHFSMHGNHAAHMIRSIGDDTRTDLSDCLVADNRSEHELIHVAGNASPTTIVSCTLANDVINASYVIHTESDLTVSNSIIDEAGTLSLDYSGNPANLKLDYILSNDTSTLSGTGVMAGVPSFVDLNGGDFHLQPNSAGLDVAPVPASGGSTSDLDGNPRGTDLPTQANVFGPYDLGAYERQNRFRECGAADSLFCDSFDH